MMERLNLMSQQSKLLGYFHFQQFNLYLDNDGTAQPAAPEKVNCWDTLLSTPTCTWDNDGTATCSTRKSKLLGYFYFQIQLVLGIMMVS
jgi:hypothetical protein